MHRVMDTMCIVCRQIFISVIFLAQGLARGVSHLLAPDFFALGSRLVIALVLNLDSLTEFGSATNAHDSFCDKEGRKEKKKQTAQRYRLQLQDDGRHTSASDGL